MKLTLSGLPDPIKGYWKIVCPACYENRPGYKDFYGRIRSLTAEFYHCRNRRSARMNQVQASERLEMNRLMIVFEKVKVFFLFAKDHYLINF